MNRVTAWIPAIVALALLILPALAFADIPSPGRCDSCAVGGAEGSSADALGLAALAIAVFSVARRMANGEWRPAD